MIFHMFAVMVYYIEKRLNKINGGNNINENIVDK